jgi:hypothetical protein
VYLVVDSTLMVFASAGFLINKAIERGMKRKKRGVAADLIDQWNIVSATAGYNALDSLAYTLLAFLYTAYDACEPRSRQHCSYVRRRSN